MCFFVDIIQLMSNIGSNSLNYSAHPSKQTRLNSRLSSVVRPLWIGVSQSSQRLPFARRLRHTHKSRLLRASTQYRDRLRALLLDQISTQHIKSSGPIIQTNISTTQTRQVKKHITHLLHIRRNAHAKRSDSSIRIKAHDVQHKRHDPVQDQAPSCSCQRGVRCSKEPLSHVDEFPSKLG